MLSCPYKKSLSQEKMKYFQCRRKHVNSATASEEKKGYCLFRRMLVKTVLDSTQTTITITLNINPP